MQVLCRAGDKFGIGDVTLEILSVTENAVEVCVVTPDGTYVELIAPSDKEEEERFTPVNRISHLLN